MITTFLGNPIPVDYLQFIENQLSGENRQLWFFNNENHSNQEIQLYTKSGLLSNSYDKKSYWYEWISKGDYDLSKIKPTDPNGGITAEEVKKGFVIADTYDGLIFINLRDGSVWSFYEDDEDWENGNVYWLCEKYADSFTEFQGRLSPKPL